MTRSDAIREPVQERSQKRVVAIMEAARALIAQNGVATLRMSDIAKEASVSVGSIYQYFPNKSAIVSALAEQVLEDNTKQNQEVFSEPPRSLIHLSHITTELLMQYYELQMQDPIVRDMWAVHSKDKELLSIDHDDDVRNRDHIFEMSKHLFDATKHDHAKRALLIIIKLGAAAVAAATRYERMEADAFMKDAKVMLYAAWEASVLPLGKMSAQNEADRS